MSKRGTENRVTINILFDIRVFFCRIALATRIEVTGVQQPSKQNVAPD